MSLENGMKVTPGKFLGYIYDYEIGEREKNIINRIIIK